MALIFSNSEQKIFDKVQLAALQMNTTCYAVGGFVRDKILQRNSKDIDILCLTNGIQLAENVAQLLNPKLKVNIFKTYGTAMLRYEDIEVEFVGARKESYLPESRNPKVMQGSFEDDIARRDFTINALAYNLETNTIIDLYNGLEDIHNKIIRTPLNPNTTFSDDPLRMLRAIRFATQLQFEIEPHTLKAIKENAYRIDIITAERVHTELNKIILSQKPSIGFKLLLQTNLLQYILPEMQALLGVEVQNGIRHKDNFYHTLQVLDNISENTDNLWLRWAAILHDIAKPNTKKFEEGIGWTFHGHEVLGGSIAYKIFKRLKLPLDHNLKYIQKLIFLHLRPIALTNAEITDSAVRRLLFEAGESIDDLMMLCKADITSKDEYKVQKFQNNYKRVLQRMQDVESKDKLRNWQPPISGDEIMQYFSLKPTPIVGQIKSAIRDAILDGKIANTKNDAEIFMIQFAQNIGINRNN